MIEQFERNVIFLPLVVLAILVPYVILAPFHSQLQGCEIATVVDKQFTGRDNDLPTLYVRVNEIVDTKTVDDDIYFGVEVGDEINYCTYVDSLFPNMMNFTMVERIEP